MAQASRLGWYVRRLRTMQPAEVAWRVGRVAQGAAAPALDRVASARLPQDDAWWEQALADFRAARGRPVLLDQDRAATLARDEPAAVADLVAAAERVREHRVRYFGYPEVDLGPVVDWHHDPLDDHHWPKVPARRLDHRTAPADVKWIWELNRLQHLPWLAEAWLLTGRDELAEEAFAQLDSWVEQNPVGVGIAWRGAFEVGVRAVSVLVALQGLRTHPGLTVARFRRLVTLLEAGARACWRERSRFTSANNHLVGELAGLAVVGLLLPELPGAERHVVRALRVLGEEAGLQVLPDGAGAEQAVGYQMFTAELLFVVMVLLRAGGREVPPALEDAVRRSGRYLAAVVGDDDPAPRYGDDDEGFALRLGPAPVREVRDHLALLRAYGAPADGSAARATGGVAVDAAWVRLATAAGPPVAPLVPPTADLPRSFHAPDGGLVVLRRGRERLTVDVAPLGYLALAAHGHADALSLTWSLDGREVVTDPGTGSYYGHPAWRVVHRGTPAHATVSVDEQDQSVIAGAFLWAEHAAVRVREVDLAAGVVDAEHDGYQRLDQPVTHRRRVVADPADAPDDRVVVVLDELVGEGEHDLRVSWPLAPDLVAEPVADGHLLRRDGVPVAQVLARATVPLRHEQVVGDEETHRGWWSPRLEARVPAYWLGATGRARLPVVVVTLLVPVDRDGRATASLTGVRVAGDHAVVSWSSLVRTGGRSLHIRLTATAADR